MCTRAGEENFRHRPRVQKPFTLPPGSVRCLHGSNDYSSEAALQSRAEGHHQDDVGTPDNRCQLVRYSARPRKKWGSVHRRHILPRGAGPEGQLYFPLGSAAIRGHILEHRLLASGIDLLFVLDHSHEPNAELQLPGAVCVRGQERVPDLEVHHYAPAL